MYEDELVSANSEVRYISLELMKIASREKRSFEEVAKEFVDNVYYLHTLIKDGQTGIVKKKATRK